MAGPGAAGPEAARQGAGARSPGCSTPSPARYDLLNMRAVGRARSLLAASRDPVAGADRHRAAARRLHRHRRRGARRAPAPAAAPRGWSASTLPARCWRTADARSRRPGCRRACSSFAATRCGCRWPTVGGCRDHRLRHPQRAAARRGVRGDVARAAPGRPAWRSSSSGCPACPAVRPLYRWYFNHVLPRIGRLVSRHTRRYDYLPPSVGAFPWGEGFAGMLRDAGFSDVRPATGAGHRLSVQCRQARSERMKPDRPDPTGIIEQLLHVLRLRRSLRYVEPVGRAINLRDGVVLSVVVHAVVVALLLLAPELAWFAPTPTPKTTSLHARAAASRTTPRASSFVQPRVDMPAPTPPPSAPSCRTSIAGAQCAEARRAAREPPAVCARQLGRAGRGGAGGTGDGARAARPEPAPPATPPRRRRTALARGDQCADGACAAAASAAAAGRQARRGAARTCRSTCSRSRSTTSRAASTNSARRFSSTPRASSSGRGSGGSSRRSSATGSCPMRRCRCAAASITVQRPQGGPITDVNVVRPRGRLVQPRRPQRAPRLEPHRAAAAGVPRRQGVLHGDVLLQRVADAAATPTPAQQLGLLAVVALLACWS